MNRLKKPCALLLSLLILLTPVLTGCSAASKKNGTAAATEPETEPKTVPVTNPETGFETNPATESVTEPATEPVTEPETEPETKAATAPATAPDTEPATEPATEPVTDPVTEPVTAPATEPATEPPEPIVFTKETVPDVPYTPVTASPFTSAEYEELVASIREDLNASEVSDPVRTVETYERMLPLSCSPDRANTREELIEIADFHAFYRESSFTVTLGYAASDGETELNYLYHKSELLPSLCSVSGTLSDGVLQISLIFYPENYLISRRDVVTATVLGGENTKPNGTDTLPGVDYEHGVSVWDSEQMAYALSKGYAVSPIENSPAAELVEAAQTILTGIVDDTMTEFRLAYRIYRWLVENAAYDYAGDKAAGRSLDQAYKPDMLPARMASFRAEGPILYGVGVCFGYAKAATVLLGLEGLDVKRVVSFSEQYLGWQGARYWVFGDTIQVHSYNYLRIGEYDYLFDLSFAKDGKLQVRRSDDYSTTDSIGATKDFCVGLSKTEQCTYYSEFPDDPYSSSDEYNPGSFHYLSEITYDGTHSLLLSSQEEAQAYYDYLLATVFSGAAEYRTVTLFFAPGAYAQSQLDAFLEATGVPFKIAEKNAAGRTDAEKMIQIAFGK